MRSRNSVTESSHPGPPRRVRGRLLALASLAAFVGYAGAQAQQRLNEEEAQRRAAVLAAQVAEEAQRRAAVLAEQVAQFQQQFDRLVFQQDGGNAAGARKRLDAELASQIRNIDQVCALTEAQKQKRRLAGRGDILRFFDRCEAAKQKTQLPEQNPAVIPRNLNALRLTLMAGLFHDDSLLYKALPNTLTGEQFALYDALARQRRASRHRASIEQTVTMLEKTIRLQDAQRRSLITLLTNETKPPRRASQYDHFCILIQLGRLPEGKVRPLLDEMQWQALNRHVAQYKGAEQQLKEAGLLADEDGEADEPPAARKE
jgi:hypothetical protein